MARKQTLYWGRSSADSKEPIVMISSTCRGRVNPYRLIPRPELVASTVRPRLLSIPVIHDWELGAVGELHVAVVVL